MNKCLIGLILCLISFDDIMSEYIITQRFEGQRIWFDKNNKKTSAPKEMETDLESVETRGIVNDVKGFLKSGKCLIICIWNYPKDCLGLTSCGWKCVIGTDMPAPDANEMDRQNDDDILNNRPDTGRNVQPSDGLDPEDIVNFFVQTVNCIGKYLPYNKLGLKKFIICLINKAFCKVK